ncbi:hypothetical protein [Corynebacterium variabile]
MTTTVTSTQLDRGTIRRHLDGNAPHADLLAAALARIRSLTMA